MFLTGISTRSLSMISKKLIGRKISAGEISNVNKELIEAAEKWRTRDLSEESIKYMFLDGVCFDMRIGKSIETVPVLVAIGVKKTGHKLVLSLLKPGMVFIDVGANIGLYSVIGAYLVGDAGKVIAFEPQSGLESIFYENLRLNQLSNVALKSLALGKNSKPGKLYQVSRTNDGQATLSVKDNERYFGNPVDVTVQRLSDVLVNLGIEFVHGVKIDTEGAELDVLEGFRKWLEKKPPNFIFFECIENHLKRFGSDTAALIYFLKQFNYRIYCLYRGRWRSIESHIDHQKYAFSPDFLAVR